MPKAQRPAANLQKFGCMEAKQAHATINSEHQLDRIHSSDDEELVEMLLSLAAIIDDKEGEQGVKLDQNRQNETTKYFTATSNTTKESIKRKRMPKTYSLFKTTRKMPQQKKRVNPTPELLHIFFPGLIVNDFGGINITRTENKKIP